MEGRLLPSHYPVPTGTRDFLPDELEERRAIESAFATVMTRHGYREARTPALEYEALMPEDALADVRPAFRVIQADNSMLVMRPDATIPIARMVATRLLRTSVPPFRLWYSTPIWRQTRGHTGAAVELHQLGAECFASSSGESEPEILALVADVLAGLNLSECRIAIGHANIAHEIFDSFHLSPRAESEMAKALHRRDYVALDALRQDAGLPETVRSLLSRRGGLEVIDELHSLAPQAADDLHRAVKRLEPQLAATLIVDAGMSHHLDYYSSLLLEVVHPALGRALGAGGQYDDLVARFGSDDLPATGFAFDLALLHRATTLAADLSG